MSFFHEYAFWDSELHKNNGIIQCFRAGGRMGFTFARDELCFWGALGLGIEPIVEKIKCIHAASSNTII